MHIEQYGVLINRHAPLVAMRKVRGCKSALQQLEARQRGPWSHPAMLREPRRVEYK